MLVAWVLAQAAAAPAATSLQARFEQATAALVAEKWGEALSDFQAIDADRGIGPRTRSVVLLREATALWHLRRDDEARDAFRKGLDLAPKTDPALLDDRITALLTVGGIERGFYDYSAARRYFEEALTLADDPTTKLRALLALAAVTMFDDNAAALKMMDQAVALAATAKVTPEVDATIRDIRGEVRLNQGDATGALADLQVALKDLGGLTIKTDLNDVAVRSDLALAALKAKQNDKAREYLAMTGEGRLPEGPFAMPANTDVPSCGGNLRPDDVVVIEFGIGDDGFVAFAHPIYASRQGPMAVEFAKAVSGWSWRAADVKSIPPFYRALTRVELRCSTAAERPGDLMLLWPAFGQWFADHKLTGPDPKGSHDIAALRAAIDDKSKRPIERIPYLYMLAISPATSSKEGEALLEQAAVLAEQEHAPVVVPAVLRIAALGMEQWSGHDGMTRYRSGLQALLARPEIAVDAQTSDVIRLLLAAPSRGGAPSDAGDLLTAVAEDKRLDAHDPLRVGAMVRLSSVQVQRGDLASARATYLRTGLDAQQCSLVDAQPVVRRAGVDSFDYPKEAVMWGIGGWTRIEFDVMPDGRTVNRRAVMSYPPFVFSDSTIKAMEATRFTQTYRPDGAIGCSGANMRFRYAMPKQN
jgi:hypothetical protein